MEAADRMTCEAVVREYLSRLLATSVDRDHPAFAPAMKRLDQVLIYHRARFVELDKPAATDAVLRELRAGRLACKVHPGVDLLEDVFLALLMEQGENVAYRVFQTRFAAKVARWARGYGAREPFWGDGLAGTLFMPRARSGPRIATYAGHGPLESWLRQVVRKLIQSSLGGSWGAMIQPDDEAGGLDGLGGRVLSHSSSCPVDVEFDRKNCRELLAPAFLGCFDALDATERLILLQYYVDGVQQKQIARELGVYDYDVTRIKQRAIARVLQRFHELAAGLVRGGRETVMICLELLQERFSDVPLDLTGIVAREKARNSPSDDGP